MSDKSMMLITSTWGENKTFRLMPIEKDCPFTEGIYDVDSKVLVMISNIKKQSFHMLAKLNPAGDAEKLSKPRANGKPFPEERKILETFQEHYISETSEIETVIKMFAINDEEFDYKAIMKSGPIAQVEKPKIILQP
jgi:hypothetical protein